MHRISLSSFPPSPLSLFPFLLPILNSSPSVPHSFSLFSITSDYLFLSSKAMHMCDELAEKVQEVEEELALTIKDLEREQNAHKLTSKQMSEVRTLPESPSPHRHTQPY